MIEWKSVSYCFSMSQKNEFFPYEKNSGVSRPFSFFFFFNGLLKLDSQLQYKNMCSIELLPLLLCTYIHTSALRGPRMQLMQLHDSQDRGQ